MGWKHAKFFISYPASGRTVFCAGSLEVNIFIPGLMGFPNSFMELAGVSGLYPPASAHDDGL